MKTIRSGLKLFLVGMLMCFSACKGQNQKTEKFRPDVRISVNKEYDKKNNVIRYDSSYSYSYAGSALPDSVFNKFIIPRYTPGWSGKSFNHFFGSDSLMRYFGHRYNDNWLFKNEEYFNNIILKDLEELDRLNQKGKQERKQREEQKYY